MSHKSREQRQREAQERKRLGLPKQEKRVADAVEELRAHPGSVQLASLLDSERLALQRAYVESGIDQEQAEGMATAAAAGKPGSWVLQATTEQKRPQEPGSIAEAVLLLKQRYPTVGMVALVPHPFRPAIQVLRWTLPPEELMVVQLSILEIERLAGALAAAGFTALMPRPGDDETRRDSATVATATGVADGGQGLGMIAMLLKASGASLEALRARVSKVRWSDAGVAISAGVECIDFDFDGKPFRGQMRGRMKDVLIGWGDENDRKVAVALLLDGHASELHEGAPA
ncbi:hypothetical protein [Ottowia sp.]|uniref:hypothetical protein n=1 Tax=Ottowia sp. TaxID=1898956 RepID=UPI0025E855C4|nr:hypothetical protein [Ottowia sp.]MBK6616639.1 hypothetical protein [Ottowia sp.]